MDGQLQSREAGSIFIHPFPPGPPRIEKELSKALRILKHWVGWNLWSTDQQTNKTVCISKQKHYMYIIINNINNNNID